MTRRDFEADVVVVGSGAAGLTAAILAHDHGADVVVLERSGFVGGTTAVSGGALWIPLNHHMADAGAPDSRDEALAYCKALTSGGAPDELVEAFVDTGHEMVRYLEERTPLELQTWSMPDYHMSAAGAKAGGRSLEPTFFDKAELGDWAGRLRQAPLFLAPVTLQEASFQYQANIRPWNLPMGEIVARMQRGLVTNGNALVGMPLKGCLDRGIRIELGARARELTIESGRITGLRTERDGHSIGVGTRAVVLASGGFEWNDELKSQYLPGPLSHPGTPPVNQGDGLLMAISAGAALANMNEIWGSPVGAVPLEEYDGAPLSRLLVPERACPHAIMVNRSGRRFVNEGSSYNELGKSFSERDPSTNQYVNQPAWAIFDRQYRERYPVLTVMPDDPDPDWLLRADSLDALAIATGIDSATLAETIARWNVFVAEGKDPDFGRHRASFDLQALHPSMGTIQQPPFYALPVYQGTLGTKGGPVTNEHAQVLDSNGEVIQGLYAAGNVMASVAGPAYYGGGATIGLAMTFGYIAGKHAAMPRID